MSSRQRFVARALGVNLPGGITLVHPKSRQIVAVHLGSRRIFSICCWANTVPSFDRAAYGSFDIRRSGFRTSCPVILPRNDVRNLRRRNATSRNSASMPGLYKDRSLYFFRDGIATYGCSYFSTATFDMRGSAFRLVVAKRLTYSQRMKCSVLEKVLAFQVAPTGRSALSSIRAVPQNRISSLLYAQHPSTLVPLRVASR